MSAAVLASLLQVSCAGPPQEDVGASTAALVGEPGVNLFTDAPGPVSSATALIELGSFSSCSGTLIGPRLVLTAAHCLLSDVTLRVSFDGLASRGVTDCWVHPDAILGQTLETCEDLRGFTAGAIAIHHDLAIIELSEEVPLSPRGIDAPRWCINREAGSGLAQSRGAFIRRGTLSRRRREAIPVSYRILGGDPSRGYVLCFDEDVVTAGSSGGTIEVDSDPTGPVVGANSQFMLSRCNKQPFIWQHDPGPGAALGEGLLNVDWIWSVLDPGGTCSFGSPGPCTPSRLGGTLSDRDRDGLPDVRDLCPDHALSADDAAECRDQHCDVDVDWIGDDCDDYDGIDASTGLPNSETVACDHDDEDGDGIPGPADPCPSLAASVTSPTDTDADGVPDACDLCPGLDNALVDFSLDADSDEIPDACDNCRDTANPLQLDCNVEAELALWQVRCPVDPGTGEPLCPRLDFTIGDACDETPCGETRVERETHGARADVELVQAAVRVDARAEVERDARTGFRFCRCRFVSRDDPDQREACVIEDSFTNPIPGGPEIILGNCGVLDSADYEEPVEPRNWRWTTMAFALDPLRPALDPLPGSPPTRTDFELRTERDLLYDPVPDDDASFEMDLWASWDLRDGDVPRWRTNFVEPIPDGLLANLTGVLWTHTPGPSGGGDATEWERDLASHFWSGRARMPTDPPVTSRDPVPCIQSITPLIARGVFGPAPMPWLGFATLGCPIVLPELRLVVRTGPDIFERQPGFDPPWFDAFEVPDLTWVAAAEPDVWLPEEDVRYVGLSNTELALRTLLVERDGGLIDVIKQDPCEVGQCEPLPIPGPLPLSASSVTMSRTLVMSARRRTVWAIDEAPMMEGAARIRALDIDRRQWRELAAQGSELGRPLAAVYDPRSDALFVLDEVRRRPHRTRARLLRIEVGRRTARARIVARWWRWTHNDRFAMTVDSEGSLYLAATRHDGWFSTIVRLEPNRRGRYRPRAFAFRAGHFVPGGLRANERGLTFVREDALEGALPINIELHELRRRRRGMRHCL